MQLLLKITALLKNMVVLLLIASLLFSITCKAFESGRFCFVAINKDISSETQYQSLASSLSFDLAGEETLRNGSQFFSNNTYSTIRNTRSGYLSYLLFSITFCLSSFLFYCNFRSYGYTPEWKEKFASISITRFIEHSDGKK